MANLSLENMERQGILTSSGSGLSGMNMLEKTTRGPGLYTSTLKTFRVIDEQDHCNKGKWSFLPQGLTQQMIERLLYYRGSACFFRWNEKFYMLPYTQKGPLDVYGRPTKITPVKFAQGNKSEEPLNFLELTPVWDVIDINEWTPKMMDGYCVIINDYTPQLSRVFASRAELNECLLESMAICVPYCRTALKNSVGLTMVRIPDEADAKDVERLNGASQLAAVVGDTLIPFVGNLQTEILSGQAAARSEEFLMSLQAWDNLRLSTHGLSSGGLFQKKSHMLEAEQNMNQGQASLILQDNIYNRQLFCDIVNSIWPLGIDYQASENVINIDRNGDGTAVETVDEEANPNKGGYDGGYENE